MGCKDTLTEENKDYKSCSAMWKDEYDKNPKKSELGAVNPAKLYCPGTKEYEKLSRAAKRLYDKGCKKTCDTCENDWGGFAGEVVSNFLKVLVYGMIGACIVFITILDLDKFFPSNREHPPYNDSGKRTEDYEAGNPFGIIIDDTAKLQSDLLKTQQDALVGAPVPAPKHKGGGKNKNVDDNAFKKKMSKIKTSIKEQACYKKYWDDALTASDRQKVFNDFVVKKGLSVYSEPYNMRSKDGEKSVINSCKTWIAKTLAFSYSMNRRILKGVLDVLRGLCSGKGETILLFLGPIVLLGLPYMFPIIPMLSFVMTFIGSLNSSISWTIVGLFTFILPIICIGVTILQSAQYFFTLAFLPIFHKTSRGIVLDILKNNVTGLWVAFGILTIFAAEDYLDQKWTIGAVFGFLFALYKLYKERTSKKKE